MSLRKYLHEKKSKIRMGNYKNNICSLGKNCYFDANIHFGGCKQSLTIGNGVRIGPNASFHVQQYNGNAKIEIRDNVFINRNFFLDCNESTIIIEDNCTIGCDVTILGTNHDILDIEGHYTRLIDKPVKLGKGTWVGTKVIILPGVSLGEGCIVGAGSVVTKSFPNYTMIAGNPAKAIKTYNFTKKEWDVIKK